MVAVQFHSSGCAPIRWAVRFEPGAEPFEAGADAIRFNDCDHGGSQRRLHSKSLRRIAELSGPPEIKRRKFYIAGGNFKRLKAALAGRLAARKPFLATRPGPGARPA